MHISRRLLLAGLNGFAVAAMLPGAAGASNTLVAGFPPEPWFAATTFDLNADLAQAKAEGKFLALLWEQTGCHYCAELHRVNFREPEIVALGGQHLRTIQMDLWGKRKFVDFDGETRPEAEIALQRFVRATPVMLFIDADGTEVFRMPGYAPPPLFMAVYQYVIEGGYKDASLRQWLDSRPAKD